MFNGIAAGGESERCAPVAEGVRALERADHADHAGNVAGIDPHKRTLTAAVIDARGGIVASEHLRVSGDGHRALEAWAQQFGPTARRGIENATGWGRHTAVFLARLDRDVRDACPNRTPRADWAR
jgi:hypothetical protein